MNEYFTLYFLHIQVVCKRNSIQEIEVQKWIEDILNEPFPIQYEEALKDGVILCRVMNTLSPGAIKKINMSGASFKLMENITRYSILLPKLF